MTHRILVVDDEPDITALVAYHLAKAGFRVSTAANGPDALKAAREEKPDIVILDLMLPGISGYDILAELRKRDETRDVGVILLTARREETDRIRGLTLGADDYLTKPFSPQELSLRVRGAAAPAGLAAGHRGLHARRRPDLHRPLGPPRHGRRRGAEPNRHGVQAAAHAGRAAGPGADPAPAAGDGVGGAARHSDPHGGHARAAAAHQAG